MRSVIASCLTKGSKAVPPDCALWQHRHKHGDTRQTPGAVRVGPCALAANTRLAKRRSKSARPPPQTGRAWPVSTRVLRAARCTSLRCAARRRCCVAPLLRFHASQCVCSGRAVRRGDMCGGLPGGLCAPSLCCCSPMAWALHYEGGGSMTIRPARSKKSFRRLLVRTTASHEYSRSGDCIRGTFFICRPDCVANRVASG